MFKSLFQNIFFISIASTLLTIYAPVVLCHFFGHKAIISLLPCLAVYIYVFYRTCFKPIVSPNLPEKNTKSTSVLELKSVHPLSIKRASPELEPWTRPGQT
ncbi:MAG: hypothetical protein LBT86_00080 [Deltaproteobacteria bacterium]|jgi:hypothetical protein|nr:hypothetical protein [Deltaproteobacteria bacterium]